MALSSLLFKKLIPVKRTVDVFVAGGGAAGFAAAVAAVRNGSKVYLAESSSSFGGLQTGGMVPTVAQFGDGKNFNAGGVGKEVYDRLWKMGGAGPYEQNTNGMNKFLPFRVEVFKKVHDAIAEESGFDFTFNTNAIGVEAENGYASAVVCFANSGIFAVRARMYVDCTSNADVAVWAGADYHKGDEHGQTMGATLCSLWSGIDWKKVFESKIPSQDYKLSEAFKDNVFSVEDRHLPGILPVGHTIGGGNVGHVYGVDGTDEASVTKAFIKARKMMEEYEKYYKGYIPGFENMELASTASMLGIRESRRIVGDYTLNAEDYYKRAVFEDEIGRYSYPIDLHASSPDEKSYKEFLKNYEGSKYHPGENYGIPYRCLLPKKLHNVIVAGKCLSADRMMQSSIRTFPGCYITGQAAGIAASLAAKANTSFRGVNIKTIQTNLKQMGAFLPNLK